MKSSSKLSGEAYLGTWSRLHGAPHVVLRLGNVYGPRQSFEGEAGVCAIFSHLLLDGQLKNVGIGLIWGSPANPGARAATYTADFGYKSR